MKSSDEIIFSLIPANFVKVYPVTPEIDRGGQKKIRFIVRKRRSNIFFAQGPHLTPLIIPKKFPVGPLPGSGLGSTCKKAGYVTAHGFSQFN